KARQRKGALLALVAQRSQVVTTLPRRLLSHTRCTGQLIGNLGLRHRFPHTPLLSVIEPHCSPLDLEPLLQDSVSSFSFHVFTVGGNQTPGGGACERSDWLVMQTPT